MQLCVDFVSSDSICLRRYAWRLCVVVAILITGACASGPEPVADETEDRARTVDRLLDAPTQDEVRRARTASTSNSMFLLPETPSEPARQIDGDPEDWSEDAFRRFDRRNFVQDGASFWKGHEDLSFRVAVDADPGFLYFFIDVRDDVVIAGRDQLTDGVVLWLRDPRLDDLIRVLPNVGGLRDMVSAEVAILVEPNARVRYKQTRQEIPPSLVQATAVQTSHGYRVELAITMEVFHQVAELPLDDIAFRIEVYDGDEFDRPGHQKVMSTLPDRGDGTSRYSIFDTGGLLPHAELKNEPIRADHLGRWKFEEGWRFDSLEAVPRNWLPFSDHAEIGRLVLETAEVQNICSSARFDQEIVDAYQARGGGWRAALLYCGARQPSDQCPESARSELVFVQLKRESPDQWVIDDVARVLPEPMEQCTRTARPEKFFYEGFSLSPVEMVDIGMWAIGWKRSARGHLYYEEAHGMHFLHARAGKLTPGAAFITTHEEATYDREKTIGQAYVYLKTVDEDKHLDICKIEESHELECRTFGHNCRKLDHRSVVMTHVMLYQQAQRRFERYQLTRHRGCPPDFDFSRGSGYLILQLPGRIGLLPTPATNRSEDEGLKVF